VVWIKRSFNQAPLRRLVKDDQQEHFLVQLLVMAVRKNIAVKVTDKT
jgi:hypothetical protein